MAATILGCGLPSRLASESLSASRRFGRGGGATARAVSECAASRSGRAPPAAHTATQCAAGDHATSFTRTPGGTLAAGSMTPMPPTSTSKSRAEPSAAPATIQRPSGESAKRASGRPAEAAPLAAEPAKAPSALLSAPAPPAARMARMVPRAPPSHSKVCVAAKKPTSTAATRSATVRAKSRRSVGAARRHVIASPSRSLHSRRDRTEGPSSALPPRGVTSTLCSRTMPSANPTHRRRPVRSNAMAVAATPGADATAAMTRALRTPPAPAASLVAHSRTPPSRAPVATTPDAVGCHAAE